MKDDPEASLVDKGGNGLWTTRVAICKGIAGPSILFLAHAMVGAGLGFACVLLCLACALNLFGAWRLILCKRALGGTYGSLALKLYGPVGSVIVQSAVVMIQCSFAMTYCIFAATTVQRLLVMYELHVVPLSALMGFQLLLQLLLALVRRIENLTAAAIVGNIGMILGALATTGYSVMLLWRGGPHPGPLLVNDKWPLMVGISMFAFEGICVMLPLYDAIQSEHKSEFLGLWNSTLMFMCCFFIFFGLLTQLAFGPKVDPYLPLSMPYGGLGTFVQLSFVVCQVSSFPLQLFPVHQVLAHMLDLPRARQSWTWMEAILQDPLGTTLRALIVVVIVATAFLLSEKVHVVAAVAASVFAIPLTSVFPSLLFLRLDNGASWASRCVDIFVIIASVGCTIFVLIRCADDLLEIMRDRKSVV